MPTRISFWLSQIPCFLTFSCSNVPVRCLTTRRESFQSLQEPPRYVLQSFSVAWCVFSSRESDDNLPSSIPAWMHFLMFCSALTFPRRLVDTRDCSNKLLLLESTGKTQNEFTFKTWTFLLLRYTTSRRRSSYFFITSHCSSRRREGSFAIFFHDVDFFFSSWATQNNTPQWPLSPNMEPSPGCKTSQLHTDLRNTRHLRCNLTTPSPLLFTAYFSQF